MRRPASSWRVLFVCILVAATGCVPTQPFYLHEDGDLSHYLDKAMTVDHPDLHTELLADVTQSQRPLSVSHPDFREFWDLSLEECVSIALNNMKVMRGGTATRLQNGQITPGTQQGALTANSLGRIFASTYDAAIVESNPGQQIGGISNFLTNAGGGGLNGPTTDGGIANVRQGVEAALAQFDTQLSITSDPSSGIMSSTDRPQNFLPNPQSRFFPRVLDLRNGGMDITLSKRTAEGTLFNVSSTTDYTRGNQRGFPVDPITQTGQPLFSSWTQTIQVEARHPLLRGRGSQINRMPIILARIGTDIELTSMMGNLQDTLNNLEVRYWDLYLAYRNLETSKVARDSALVTWRIVYDKFAADVEPVQAEAQAQEQYYNFRAQVESALRSLYDNENELRLLMGLTATDGRLIRPKDDPTLARVEFDWTDILAEAIARRPELIQQRWRVKQRELELILARNQLLPQLDVGAQYRWLGFGDDLIQASRTGVEFPGVGSNAFESLTGGDFQEFSILFQYQMPIGFRRELAAVRHAQLRLAREKAVLEDTELDVSHGLSHGLRNMETNFQLAQTNSNRWAAAQREVEALDALYRGGRVSLDLALEAQRRRAVAQGAFWAAVVEYNKSIADLHTRKGSIMDYDGIAFEEGPWPQKAYWDALGRARERDAGWYIDYGWTRPKVVSQGPISQGNPGGMPIEGLPATTSVEELPAPEPTPARPTMTDETSTSPLPPPQPMPQETRATPRMSSPRAAAADRSEVEVAAAAPGRSSRGGATRPVSQASHWSPTDESSSNPLRSGTRQPIGAGVVVSDEESM